jgi:Tfp pilus assembly protein PilP
MKTMKIFTAIFAWLLMVFLLTAQTTAVDTGNDSKKAQESRETEVAPEENRVPIPPTEQLDQDEFETGDFIYKPRGRRDPFVNPLRGKNINLKREAKEGVAGLLIDELELEGILFKEGKYIAMFKGPDGRPYDVRVGDSVYDGEVIKIDFNAVVFKRILTIALGGTKEKIITKPLIPEEEASKQ